MTIGEKIYELRSSRNMSLRDFAKLTGVTHTTIARLESPTMGPQKIFLDTIYQICKKLNYSFELFLYETGYITKNELGTPTAALISGAPSYSSEERELIEKYRNLPEQLKKLVRDQLEIYSSPNELIFKTDKKV